MKKLLVTLGVIAVIALAIFLVAGYFLGNVPLASQLMGTNKPKDLGVELSVDSVYTAMDKMNTPANKADVEAIIKNPASYTKVNTTLTDEEVSSMFSLANIENFPFRTNQIKFGSNGQVEASGTIDTVKLEAFLNDMGVSGSNLDQVMGYVQSAKFINYYFDGTCSVTNNNVSLNIDELKLGNISVPDDLLSQSENISGYISH
jgi:hypothetical protein